MQRERYTVEDLEIQLACLNADLCQSCGSMTVTSLESLCRRINIIRIRINSFKGGLSNGNKRRQ